MPARLLCIFVTSIFAGDATYQVGGSHETTRLEGIPVGQNVDLMRRVLPRGDVPMESNDIIGVQRHTRRVRLIREARHVWYRVAESWREPVEYETILTGVLSFVRRRFKKIRLKQLSFQSIQSFVVVQNFVVSAISH